MSRFVARKGSTCHGRSRQRSARATAATKTRCVCVVCARNELAASTLHRFCACDVRHAHLPPPTSSFLVFLYSMLSQCCTTANTGANPSVCGDVPTGKQYGTSGFGTYTATTTCGSTTNSVLADCSLCFVVDVPTGTGGTTTCSTYTCSYSAMHLVSDHASINCPAGGCNDNTVRVCGVCARNELASLPLHCIDLCL